MTDVDATIGVLVSGGLDSCILLASLLEQGQRVQPFYVDSELFWQGAELAALRRFLSAVANPRLAELVIFKLPLADVYGQHWSVTGDKVPDADSPDQAVYLPGRNVLLSIKAALYCQLHHIRRLALAPLGTSPFADATREYFDRFASLLNTDTGPPLTIELPFSQFDKRAVMQLGKAYPLEHTFSCIDPRGELHCGRCNKCAERQQAFRTIGAPDPTRYAYESR